MALLRWRLTTHCRSALQEQGMCWPDVAIINTAPPPFPIPHYNHVISELYSKRVDNWRHKLESNRYYKTEITLRTTASRRCSEMGIRSSVSHAQSVIPCALIGMDLMMADTPWREALPQRLYGSTCHCKNINFHELLLGLRHATPLRRLLMCISHF